MPQMAQPTPVTYMTAPGQGASMSAAPAYAAAPAPMNQYTYPAQQAPIQYLTSSPSYVAPPTLHPQTLQSLPSMVAYPSLMMQQMQAAPAAPGMTMPEASGRRPMQSRPLCRRRPLPKLRRSQ